MYHIVVTDPNCSNPVGTLLPNFLATFICVTNLPALIHASRHTSVATAVNMVIFGMLGQIPTYVPSPIPTFRASVLFYQSVPIAPVVARFIVSATSPELVHHQLAYFLVSFYLSLANGYPNTAITEIRTVTTSRHAVGYAVLGGDYPNLGQFISSGGLNGVNETIRGRWTNIEPNNFRSIALLDQCTKVCGFLESF